MLTITPIEAFSDNYIWLLHNPDTRQAFVVDPGDAAPVLAALEAMQLQLAGILITHHHFDHVGGLEALLNGRYLRVYGPDNPAISGLTQVVCAGDAVDVLGHRFDVLEVPGHTLDHIAYIEQASAEPALFCGDTLFAGGCGRLFEGTPQMMHQSLQKIAALPANTRVYCAHEYTLANLAFAHAVEPGNDELGQRIDQAQGLRAELRPTVPSELALELATNPFLRCDQPSVHNTLLEQGRLSSTVGVDVAEVFAAVRGWKDNF